MYTGKTIYVYDDFSSDGTILMGQLYIDLVKGRETYSFEYDSKWLDNVHTSFCIDPDIKPYPGRQYSTTGALFGIFADSSPDRWGRVLMKKREKNIADNEKRKPRTLHDSDFLIGVYDETRMGGLRLKYDPNGDFLSCDNESPVPPWTTLRTLEEASRNFESSEIISNKKWLEQLIRPGSSLGGARPKATVIDTDSNLWIAKFPSKNDDNNVGAWEKVVSDLASQCGLDVPESRLETFSKYGSTFLVKRFDRAGQKRIHFASAMTLLGKTDGTSAADGIGYLDIASFIKANGSNPKADLKELWRRVVFNMAVSNTDDHLRNHAFLFDKSGWKLSPLFDVNPVPHGDELSLNINNDDNRISFLLAKESSCFFGITRTDAEREILFISDTVKNNWEKLAEKYGITRKHIEDMRPAFSEFYRHQ